MISVGNMSILWKSFAKKLHKIAQMGNIQLRDINWYSSLKKNIDNQKSSQSIREIQFVIEFWQRNLSLNKFNVEF